MASPALHVAEHHARPLVPTLVEELLEEIFLRLPTPDALARASTACTSFHRIITARPFLRRFRKLHPPPLLGFLAGRHGLHAAEAPHPSAPLARAVASAADFSYSFVPPRNEDERWVRCDVRDGRVLLQSVSCDSNDYNTDTFQYLVVCDPLSRRYGLLPPVPRCLIAQEDHSVCTVPFLSSIDEDEDETLFRVIYMAHYNTKLVAFVFSSVTRQWSVGVSTSWNSMGVGASTHDCALLNFTYACGCFYWPYLWTDRLLALDARKLEFSTIDYQTSFGSWRAIVAGREGTPEMLSFGDYLGDGTSVLFRIIKQNRGESSNKRQSDDIIPLPCQYDYATLGAAEGFLLLRGSPKNQNSVHSSAVHKGVECFSLEVKTSKLVKVCGMPRYFRAHLFFGFPPSWTEPSI